VNPTWAVILPEGAEPANLTLGLELMTLEDAVENAKFMAAETGLRWSVHKLTESHTFRGKK
jgi:hypothetical protein